MKKKHLLIFIISIVSFFCFISGEKVNAKTCTYKLDDGAPLDMNNTYATYRRYSRGVYSQYNIGHIGESYRTFQDKLVDLEKKLIGKISSTQFVTSLTLNLNLDNLSESSITFYNYQDYKSEIKFFGLTLYDPSNIETHNIGIKMPDNKNIVSRKDECPNIISLKPGDFVNVTAMGGVIGTQYTNFIIDDLIYLDGDIDKLDKEVIKHENVKENTMSLIFFGDSFKEYIGGKVGMNEVYYNMIYSDINEDSKSGVNIVQDYLNHGLQGVLDDISAILYNSDEATSGDVNKVIAERKEEIVNKLAKTIADSDSDFLDQLNVLKRIDPDRLIQYFKTSNYGNGKSIDAYLSPETKNDGYNWFVKYGYKKVNADSNVASEYNVFYFKALEHLLEWANQNSNDIQIKADTLKAEEYLNDGGKRVLEDCKKNALPRLKENIKEYCTETSGGNGTAYDSCYRSRMSSIEGDAYSLCQNTFKDNLEEYSKVRACETMKWSKDGAEIIENIKEYCTRMSGGNGTAYDECYKSRKASAESEITTECNATSKENIGNEINQQNENVDNRLYESIEKYLHDMFEGVGVEIQNKKEFCNILYDTKNKDGIYPYIKFIVDLIRIGGPILIIFLTAFDGLKTITSFKEDENKKFLNHLKIRLICLVLLILIPSLIKFLVDLFVTNECSSELNCALFNKDCL